MADNKPVPQCSHQQRKRQQIHPALHPHPRPILLPSRERLLQRSPRSQRPRAPSPQHLARNAYDIDQTRPLRSRRQRRRFERILDEKRRNQAWNRHLPRHQSRCRRAGEKQQQDLHDRPTQALRRPHHHRTPSPHPPPIPRQIPQSRHPRRLRNSPISRPKLHPRNGPAPPPPHPPPTIIDLAPAQPPNDVARQSGTYSRHERFRAAACTGSVSAEAGCAGDESGEGVLGGAGDGGV